MYACRWAQLSGRGLFFRFLILFIEMRVRIYLWVPWTRLALAKQKNLMIYSLCIRIECWESQTDIRDVRVSACVMDLRACMCVHFDEIRQAGGLTKSIIIGWMNYRFDFWYWDVRMKIDLFASFLVAALFIVWKIWLAPFHSHQHHSSRLWTWNTK